MWRIDMYYAVLQDFAKDGIIPEMMKPHVDYMQDLQNQGLIIASGPFSDQRAGGMYIIEAENEESAIDVIKKDPAVMSGILKNEIRPFRLLYIKE